VATARAGAACGVASGARAPDSWAVQASAAATAATWKRRNEATRYFLSIRGYCGSP